MRLAAPPFFTSAAAATEARASSPNSRAAAFMELPARCNQQNRSYKFVIVVSWQCCSPHAKDSELENFAVRSRPCCRPCASRRQAPSSRAIHFTRFAICSIPPERNSAMLSVVAKLVRLRARVYHNTR